MSQFIETIKISNGTLYNLDWHQQRVSRTFKNFFPNKKILKLKSLFKKDLPTALTKVRLLYDASNYQIKFIPYQRRNIQSISFHEVDFNYDYKYADRAAIDKIKATAESDEVIFMRNGMLLDSSYSNLALYDGEKWFTPRTYLLNGTTRQRLLYEQKLTEIDINKSDLHNFEKISFINALNDLGENTMDLKS